MQNRYEAQSGISSEPSWGATTHPEIIAGIIEYLQEHDFSESGDTGRLLCRQNSRGKEKLCGYYDIAGEISGAFPGLAEVTLMKPS